MEIVINKRTYVLKPVNQYRRELFIKGVLPFYTVDKLPKEQEKKFLNNIYFVLWEFIKDVDKKEIGVKENLEIKQLQLNKFIDWINNTIVEYSKYIKFKSGSKQAKTEKIEIVFDFLSSRNGWTPEYMQEMDELTLLKALSVACNSANKENLNKLNIGALVGAFSAGSKQAKRKIDELNRDARLDAKVEGIKHKKVKKRGEFLSDEQLRNL